ncbi:E1 protein [Molossus molossus papillomavirus type 2]|nr:E1 protein [Molossus molossus papillomavirus type 2]
MADKGTDDEWFIVREADVEGEDSLEELFECDTESDISGLLDDTDVQQGNSLKLFQQQEAAESARHELFLKRKCLCTPEQERDLENLSPRLSAVQISPKGSAAKKRLFGDSGIDTTDEAPCASKSEVSKPKIDIRDILKSQNHHAAMLAKFKGTIGAGYNDLTRPYHSQKTMGNHWVVFLYGPHPSTVEGGKKHVGDMCDYCLCYDMDFAILFLCNFKKQKCRSTICSQMKSLFSINELCILCDPPRLSVPSALFFFKLTLGYKNCTITGDLPDWIAQRTLVNHQSTEKPFVLSDMIQWAYDNQYTEESLIAYNYALLADEDTNAKAFIQSNNQAKHVRDCCYMVKQYMRAEMQNATMSAWIHKRRQKIENGGDWREIARFLKYQQCSVFRFEETLRYFLKGHPKRCCIVIYGPSDTGKSFFANSLNDFLGGRVLSFQNYQSHFWLSPLADAKVALLDDATTSTWNYFDMYLRSALDGSFISVDCKNRAPIQIKCPPLLVTTNCDISNDDKFKFLRSRLTFLNFNQPLPFDADGKPAYCLSKENWSSYFERFWSALELSDQEDEGEDGEPQSSFRPSGK